MARRERLDLFQVPCVRIGPGIMAQCATAGSKIGICGQAPSNYLDFVAFLVGEGIDAIPLNPDSFVRTVAAIAAAEAAGR